MNVRPSAISMIESSENVNIRLDNVVKMAEIFGITTDMLLTESLDTDKPAIADTPAQYGLSSAARQMAFLFEQLTPDMQETIGDLIKSAADAANRARKIGLDLDAVRAAIDTGEKLAREYLAEQQAKNAM